MPTVTYDSDRLSALRVVETLRSGVPTRYTTRHLPDLRPDLMNGIREDLERFGEDHLPSGRLVWGKYGQGKSHFLTMVEHAALDMGFAVSFVTMSREVSCHQLFSFYRRVAPIVRVPNSNVPGIQMKLAQRKPSDLPESPIQQPDRYSHRLPAIVCECLLHARGSDEAHNLYSDLAGDRLPLPEIRRVARDAGIADLLRGLPRFRLDHADAYFGVFSDAIRFCGFRGWVILIDEVELTSRLGRVSRLNAYKNLNWLLNWSGGMCYPIYTVGAAATSLQDVWYQDSGGRRADRSTIPEMAEERFGPSVREEIEEFFDRAVSEQCPTIGSVKRDRLDELLEDITRLHGTAHAWKPPSFAVVRASLSSLTADHPVRSYVRATLEALDQILLTGETPDLQPAELVEGSTEEEPEYFRKEETEEES